MDTSLNLKIFILQSDNSSDEALQKAVTIFHGSSSSGKLEPEIKIVTSEGNSKELDPDYCFMLKACNMSTPDSFTIICKEDMVTSVPQNVLLDILEKVMFSYYNDKNFDLFYLANWMDRCELYSDHLDVNDTGLKMVTTQSPNGMLCLMMTPRGKNKILKFFNPETNPIYCDKNSRSLGQHLNDLSQQTGEKSLDAKTTTVPLITFDLSQRKSDAELMKMSQCRHVTRNSKETIDSIKKNAIEMAEQVRNGITPTTKTEILKDTQDFIKQQSADMSFFWFAIVVIIILIVAWILIRFTTGGSPSSCSNGSCFRGGMNPKQDPTGAMGTGFMTER